MAPLHRFLSSINRFLLLLGGAIQSPAQRKPVAYFFGAASGMFTKR
jgi:hypothetical protein